MDNKHSLVILGGGISGLVLAYYAYKQGRKVILLESGKRWGGMIESTQTEYGLVESAANGILNSKTTEELFSELGLELTHHFKASRKRYFWNGKTMTRFPISAISALRALIGFFFYRSDTHKDDNLWEWSKRVFGNKVTAHLIEPALGGIYGTPLKYMHPQMMFFSLDWTIKKTLLQRLLHTKKSKHPNGKEKPKVKGLVSFSKGMEEFPKALVKSLEGQIDMRLSFTIPSLTELTSQFPKSQICICLPLKKVRDYVKQESWMEETIKKYNVKDLNYQSISTTTRFSGESIFQKPGFGVLFPEGLGIQAKGVLSNDSIFPDRIHRSGVHSETWIHSGEFLKDASEPDVQKLVETDRKVLLSGQKQKDAGISEEKSSNALASFTKIWKEAFPVYDHNLYLWNQALDEIEATSLKKGQSIQFFGNYRKGIGLRSLIENAKNAMT